MTVLSSAVLISDHIVSPNKPELGQHVSVVWMQTWILTRTWACLCAFEQMGRKKNRLDRDNLETETPLAQVLWVTSWFQPAESQWGLGRPPVCFQGNRALSPPPPHKTSHSLSLCLCPCLSLSLSLLHAPMFFLGGVEEEGDDEVTHCNIIAMAMKSEPRGEKENGNFHRWRRDGNGCHDLCFKNQNGNFSVAPLILKYFFTKNPHFYLSLPTTSSSSSFLLCLSFPFRDSSPCVLLPLLLARCAPPPPHMLSKEYVFHWCITLSHVARVFRHAEVKCYVMLTYARLALRQGQRWSHGTERRGEVNWGQWNTSRRKNKEKL